jgi:hypothetical protein
MLLDRYGGQVKLPILYVVIQGLSFVLKTIPIFAAIGSKGTPI